MENYIVISTVIELLLKCYFQISSYAHFIHTCNSNIHAKLYSSLYLTLHPKAFAALLSNPYDHNYE